MEIDATALSRYERGRGSKEFTPGLRRKIEKLYGEEVAEWIAMGELPEVEQKSTASHNDISEELSELVESFSKLSPKKQKYYLHKIIAEALEEELKKEE